MPRLLFLFCLLPLLLAAQIDPVADAIKPNVVAITADFPSGGKEQGFGFVVGERNNVLYLATAGHVVREDGAAPGKENADNIRVVFCGDDRSYPARILKATISPFDFGLLELSKPPSYVWKADCLDTKPAVGTSVGYIGRNNRCYIPTATVRGTVNTLNIDFISVDINGVSRGTSGAPLIGSDGLIGMIVTAESSSADALTIERLQEEITQEEKYPFRFGLQPGGGLRGDLETYYMVKIEGGFFEMGCKESRDGGLCQNREIPSHEVKISSFYLGKYEVTNEDFIKFLNAIYNQLDVDSTTVSYQGKRIFGLGSVKNLNCPDFTGQIKYYPQKIKGNYFAVVEGYEKYPVVMISKHGAEFYCDWLSKLTRKNYRLPTEAEWEFAARGGNLSKGYRYAGLNNLVEVGWYWDNSGCVTHQIG